MLYGLIVDMYVCGSVSEEEPELPDLDTAEADGELQVITECWVEPQYGVVVDSPQERVHLDGLRFREVPQAVSTPHVVWALLSLDETVKFSHRIFLMRTILSFITSLRELYAFLEKLFSQNIT